MIVELAIATGVVAGYRYLNNSDKRKFKKRFVDVMEGIGIKNKQDNTFSITDLETTTYGFRGFIKIPYGLSLEHLESKKNILEDNLNGIIDLDKDKFKSYIKMRIVDRDIDKFMFEPVKCPSDRLYVGKDFTGKDFFLNLNKDPHVLIGGTTGTGKSFLLASILTNLIYNYPKDVDVYLSQIVKGEIGAFANCKSVKFTAYSIEEVLISLGKVCKILDSRAELFTKYGIKNITQWNQHYTKRRMKRVVYVLEELSFFIQEPECWEFVLKILKAGRSVGIHIIGLLQRSTATNLPPDAKAQMTRISFRQKSIIDSQNIINTNDATKLKERECIVDSNNGADLIKVPWIDEDYIMLNKYIPEIAIPNNEKDEVIEVTNIIKEDNKILLIEEPTIIDIETNDIKPVKKKTRKGIISLEDIEDVDRKR